MSNQKYSNDAERLAAYMEFVLKGPDPGDCWIWLGRVAYDGYGRVGKGLLAHRFIYEQLRGPIPEGMDILHKCDLPSCVNPDHLWAGTAKENLRDCVAKGHGTKQRSGCRLTWITVQKIRQLYAQGGITQKALAERFGVSYASVKRVIQRVTFTTE